MVTKEQLSAHFGDESAETYYSYLSNKHRGGVNNSKGNTFENYFSIYLLAKLFNENRDAIGTLFSSQAFSFIDDLVIELNVENCTRYYQIKDVESLSWGSGIHPIETDFEVQYNVSSSIGTCPELYMTVSRKELCENLIENLPESIKPFTNVVHFETASSVNNLIRSNSHFKDELIKMCAISNPSPNMLDTLATIILGVWDASDKKQVSIKALIDKCYDQNPNYIKGFNGRLSEKLSNQLGSIKGFSFKVENGYLVWNYYSTDSGTFPYPIGTTEFLQWENDIVQLGEIDSFEIIEPFLS